MKECKSFEISETKRRIFDHYGWNCQYPECISPSIHLAHKIAKTKKNIKKYGKGIIYHDFNLIPVCGISEHNDHFNIGNNPVKCDRLIARIRKEAGRERRE